MLSGLQNSNSTELNNTNTDIISSTVTDKSIQLTYTERIVQKLNCFGEGFF